ncbi:GIY-YIG nuclease family protein [Salmonella enterica]|uniref:GIY-YIG nuclease family protein n=1 Tax=Salmonella enterica TaxID=28901 RepID=UPI0021D50059|nr:GIY-YIG nuclease family protein [Salmonella enterica]MCU7121065.1 GIY-YIG nuclease family protein [Salmonella enterica]
MVYVLKLECDKYYVGYTLNFHRRMEEHFSGNGSLWTQKYSPIECVEVIHGFELEEKYTTLRYMEKYGSENVRGGPWCKVDMSIPSQEQEIKKLLTGSSTKKPKKSSKLSNFDQYMKSSKRKKPNRRMANTLTLIYTPT